MQIVKSTGEKQAFNKAKLCVSLKRSGAPDDMANAVCAKVEEKVTPGISTSKVYREALRYLVKEDRDVAARYSLYRGIAALGPAGFLFEQYIEVVLQAHGYKTMRDIYVKGACISHEIDLIAIKDGTQYFMELKYHNEQGIKTHVPVIMYAYARLDDLSRAQNEKAGQKYKNAMWLITNTKFTDTALQYAKCKRIRLSGWNYPDQGGLEDMIVEKKLYPVTVLPSINQQLLVELAKRKIILAQDLATYSVSDLKKMGITETLGQKIIQEVTGLFK
jgi:hypothetical protein